MALPYLTFFIVILSALMIGLIETIYRHVPGI